MAAWDFNCWFLRPLLCTFDVAAGDHDRGVVAAATPPHNLLSPATAMRTIKPGEAIHSAHSTINPSPGTHEAFCFWNVKRSCHYVLSANHSEFHSGFDALTGEPCIISDMFPICEPDIPVQMQTDHAFRERHSIRYIFWLGRGVVQFASPPNTKRRSIASLRKGTPPELILQRITYIEYMYRYVDFHVHVVSQQGILSPKSVGLALAGGQTHISAE